MKSRLKKHRLLSVIGPGLLVAATGVGAGDLATAALTGIRLGPAILWAVLVGTCLKFVLNEGLARWQMATGETLIEGVVGKFGMVAGWIFLPYLFLWSYLVSLALMSACGVTFHALCPVFGDDAGRAKIVFGMAHSVLGLFLVLLGGFRLFEVVMKICIGVMFVTVVVTACALWPGTDEVLQGLFFPRQNHFRGESLTWTVALMGGVGGTVTVLCYGYWIREAGREGEEDLGICRIDLGVGYAMTALFGLAMVIIGSTVTAERAGGATLIVEIGKRLEESLGTTARWAFLLGAWGAVFSSLLGVWQAVPYIFSDFCHQLDKKRSGRTESSRGIATYTSSRSYRAYLFSIALLPMLSLGMNFSEVQKLYAVTGSLILPLLSIALLILNGRSAWVGERLRNRWYTVLILLLTLAFFTWFLSGKLKSLLDL